VVAMSSFYGYADRDYEAGEIFDRGVNANGDEWVLRLQRPVKEGDSLEVDNDPESMHEFEHYKNR